MFSNESNYQGYDKGSLFSCVRCVTETALAVDHEAYSAAVSGAIAAEPLVRLRRQEVESIHEDDEITIVASGPLTSTLFPREIRG